jgi:branched-chain amino acid aminotransferase
VDGEYVAIKDAKLSLLDWGFLRSDATYDVAHVWHRRFFRLDLHINRFLASVEGLHMQLPIDRTQLEQILYQCARRAGMDDLYVEMICTRGMAPATSRDPRLATNRFMAFAIPFVWIANEQQRAQGLHLNISTVQRIPAESVDPRIKNYHWLDFVSALFNAYDQGADNTVMVDRRGNLTEGPGFNVFIVEDGVVSTPSSGVLEGITRRSIIELCHELQYPVDTAPLASNRLRTADEVFISSTAGGIMPVTTTDGATVADGNIGPITRALTDAYWAKHRDPAWSSSIDPVRQKT